MRKLISAIFLFGTILMTSAQELNDYKYIIIPETYEFLGEVNQYQLNALTKFLFEKNGYNTLMVGENKPQDLNTDPCLGLRTKLLNNSGLFVTKLVIQLEDCQGNVVFTSQEGRSREKDFKASYQEALRDAFTSIEEMEYQYDAKQPGTAAKTGETASVRLGVTAAPAAETKPISKDSIAEVKASETSENSTYSFSGKEYELKTAEQGYGLYQLGSAEPIAILIETDSGDNFIYNSLTNQGVAYFDAEKNLIVEYFSRKENKKISLTYKLNN
ncbi:hypothetical protein GCM10023115_42230 [Pontixanthobacter gangjinensis]|uniref:Uncharacterized protein n=1 Tax=Christiangramia aestuarii TaxID=1028746 RepID=A0A7M3SYK5_9FLAO|nr:hypothetical protein [Christiangramia aestuarii]MUP41686.1 hypothetical protein [Christiangramia aestuarii]